MRVKIQGKSRNFKSLNFTLLKGKLVDGTKCQTARTNFIPSYRVGETIAISFRKVKGGKKELLFLVPVQDYYPKRVCDLLPQEAIYDGFEYLSEFKEKLMELNSIKFEEHYCFLTRWDPEKRIFPDEFDNTLEEWV